MKSKNLMKYLVERGPATFVSIMIIVFIIIGGASLYFYSHGKKSDTKLKLNGHASPMPADTNFGTGEK